MSIVNGLFTKPLNADEVASYFGVATNDPTVFLRPDLYHTSDFINKWSIHKPYDRQSMEELSDESIQSAKAAQGIYYGLKAATHTWGVEIHDATWEYVDRPSGDITVSPFRGSDLWGYDDNARPTLYGEIVTPYPGRVIYTFQTPFTFKLIWNFLNNTTGVDVFKCGSFTGTDVSGWYLCVMIDSYAAIMLDNTGNRVPVSKADSGYDTYSCPELPDSLKVIESSRKVSFFLADIGGTANNELSAMLQGEWVKLESIKGDIEAITIPEAVGYSLKWDESAYNYGKMDLFVEYSSADNGIAVEVSFREKPAEDLYYALQFTLPGYTDKFQTVLFGGTGKGDFTVIYTANDLALKWSEGDKFTYVAELYGYQGQVITSQPLATATGEITIS